MSNPTINHMAFNHLFNAHESLGKAIAYVDDPEIQDTLISMYNQIENYMVEGELNTEWYGPEDSDG